MVYIAEARVLLLLDNAAARPVLGDLRRQRTLSAAVLLDLAYACRVRPAEPGDPVPAGTLLPLYGPDPVTAAHIRALRMLARKPTGIATAIEKLRGKVETQVYGDLERHGQIHSIRLYTKGFRRQEAWTMTDRTRPARLRAAVLATLTDGRPPEPHIAAIISLLYFVDGLGSLLSFDERGWEQVTHYAGEIASGGWLVSSEPSAAEINLAVTTAVVRTALGGR